ncbi:hypothetical protein Droror1_Dr00001358 [Drosera rotundifolia]
MESYIAFATKYSKQVMWASKVLGKMVAPPKPATVPEGYVAVYVGVNEKQRFVIPLGHINHPSFQNMLTQAEEEFGFCPPLGGLTIPCHEDIFFGVTSLLDEE